MSDSRGRRRALAALLLGTALALTTACGGSSGGGRTGGGRGGEESRAVVTITPRDGASDVGTSGALRVTARQGSLTSVKVTDGKGRPVEGRISGDGSSWEPSGHLAAATRYTVDAMARDKDGRQSAKHAVFTTLTPKNTFVAYFTPEDGSEVGVGMPVSLDFSRGITDPRSVEKAVRVTADPPVEIRSHWFGNDRLDFRPEKYWTPGTKVTLSMNLDGVQGREGVYGTQNKTVRFTIGRSQISTVDTRSHEMTVRRDGKAVRTIPISAGGPGHTTYNGQMVISEKFEVTRMNGDTVGFGGEYDIKDVPHAMRLSSSGTFIHGNYWSGEGTFGSANVSHGCVGLFDERGGGDPSTPAAWFYNHSLIGDVVVVENSPDKTIQPDNGLNGWNMPWSQWTAGG
ncbi:L,D-transpeptidase [Streptomyces orinoci]|uniref:Ig-like domain-containing protein n=1 Tax=Streptomyces orinoci TaxID=67339 RepID=A0ABV3K2V7_STRON|nr:Ig-like domain-containing protein [Streptomyces orinoci]